MATTKVIKDLTEFNPGNPDYVLNATNAVTVINSGGNQYNFNGVYGKFGLRIGTTVLTGVPSGHPIAVLNNGLTGITYTGTVNEGTLAVGGVTYTFYSGDVTITVTADFGVASYYCKIHGYMGGQDNLVSVYSEAGLRMPTGGAFSGTPAEGMMRNDTTQASEGSASTMQHYTGDNVWKNFVNVVPNPFTYTPPSGFSAPGGTFSTVSGDASASFTLSNSDLTASNTSGSYYDYQYGLTNLTSGSGKYYCEITIGGAGFQDAFLGVIQHGQNMGFIQYKGAVMRCQSGASGGKVNQGYESFVNYSSNPTSTSGDIISIYYNHSTRYVGFYVNGTDYGNVPVALDSGMTDVRFVVFRSSANATTYDAIFG